MLPTEIDVRTWQGVVSRHSARTPPTPLEDTNSVSPRIRSVEDCDALRAGPAPWVENGTSVMNRLKLSFEVSWPVMCTSSRWPRAWDSIERPAPVSEKKMIPPASAGTSSLPVRAITVRPTVIVTEM